MKKIANKKYMKDTTKKFVGGIVVGVLIGALIGGFTVATIASTAFINYSLAHTK